MNRRALALWIGAGICAALFAFAFIAAPKSCEWGLNAYFWSGIAVIITLIAVPAVLRTDRTVLSRALIGLAFGAIGMATWLAGLFVANVRIICRLF